MLLVQKTHKSTQDSTDQQTPLSSQFGNTTSESSIELPTQDSLFLEQLLNSSHISSQLSDNWLENCPIDSFDELFSDDSKMTFKELTDIPMEHSGDCMNDFNMVGHTGSPLSHDEATSSPVGSFSEDNERDDINRRGLKKSGGPFRKLARFGNKQVIKYSDEYHDRRVKNNEAVKKSRMKAKEKQKETEVKMSELANENRALSDRVDMLLKELQVLKSLYRELNQDIPASAVKELERVNVR